MFPFSFSCLCICCTRDFYTLVCFHDGRYYSLAFRCRIPLSISFRTGLVVMNECPQFLHIWKKKILLHFLRIALLGIVFWLVDFFFPSSTLNISSHCLLTCKVCSEKSTVSLMLITVYVTWQFSLDVFRILSLTFDSLIIICFGEDLCGLNLFGNSWASGSG